MSMITINSPDDLQDVQCHKCKRIMKAHPMSNMNSDYFTNCELHMTAEVIIDAPYHSTAESIKNGNKRTADFAKKFCEQYSDLLKRMSGR